MRSFSCDMPLLTHHTKNPSHQPNIFPKFLFHFADFPYELYIHQPEPAQLGNLLRFTVRALPMVQLQFRNIFLRFHFQGANPWCTDLQLSIVSKPGNCKIGATSIPTHDRFFSDRFHSKDHSPLWELEIFPQFPRGCLKASSLVFFGVAVSKPGYFAVLDFQQDSFSRT